MKLVRARYKGDRERKTAQHKRYRSVLESIDKTLGRGTASNGEGRAGKMTLKLGSMTIPIFIA